LLLLNIPKSQTAAVFTVAVWLCWLAQGFSVESFSTRLCFFWLKALLPIFTDK
jgi:hypothetical protein